MKILPITNINRQIASKGRNKSLLLQSHAVDKIISEPLKNLLEYKKAGNLMKGLTIFAGSMAAGYLLAKALTHNSKTSHSAQKTENNVKQKNEKPVNTNTINKDYADFIKKKPERELFLKITSEFPNLDREYKKLLIKSAEQTEHSDSTTLNIIENVFDLLSSDNKLKYTRSYFDALDKDYSDCLDGVAKNILSTVKNGASPMYYLVLINNGKLTKSDVLKWSKAENISCDEFMVSRNLPEQQLINISKLKEENNDFIIKNSIVVANNDKDGKESYLLRYKLQEDKPLSEQLKTIAKIHEAIYGKIPLSKTEVSSGCFEDDVQNEMQERISKDRQLDSVYNFVKFVTPQALKNFALSQEEIKNLIQDCPEHKKLRNACKKIIMKLNYQNKNFIDMCNVLNDNDLWDDLFQTIHSRMRFITRIVLKDNQNPKNLSKRTYEVMEKFKHDLEKNLTKCNFFSYRYSQGKSPQFYLSKCSLGNYIKITLDREGSIHTIYEDSSKQLY